MPWEGRTVDQMREEFASRAHAQEETMAALCREYGITRRTGYKWLARFEAGEASERSRRPERTRQIAAETEREIVRYRQRYPALGAAKLRRLMQDEGWEDLPSAKTFNNVFHRNGLITREASERATPYKRFERDRPNALWQADFLGHFALGTGERCYTLNALDDHSCFSLCCEPLHGETLAEVIPVMTRLFETYGLPDAILCDNGNPWGTAQASGMTQFEVWMMEHGVLTIHGRPLHPQTQGKEERFNDTLRRELLNGTTLADWDDARARLAEYRQFYNEKRQHQALGLDTPASRYAPSERAWSAIVPAWEYPEGAEIRRVRGNGCFSWENRDYFLSYAFKDKEIAIRPSGVEGRFNLLFRQFRVAQLDTTQENPEKSVTRRGIYLIENDPRQTDT